MVKISPSILSADFSRLGEEIASVSMADYLHFDVMDGRFVPNISIGIPVLESVRKNTDMFLDVHLMIADPYRYTARFADAGADLIVFHLEAETDSNIELIIREIHEKGKKVGIAIKPATSEERLMPWLSKIDLALVMTVEPGFGGQKFMEDMMPKVRNLRRRIESEGLNCELEVDGGVNPKTAEICILNGADVLVAGSDIFKASDRSDRIQLLRRTGK